MIHRFNSYLRLERVFLGIWLEGVFADAGEWYTDAKDGNRFFSLVWVYSLFASVGEWYTDEVRIVFGFGFDGGCQGSRMVHG
jgi:hypothetical protein